MKRTSEAILRFAIQNPGWHTLCRPTKGVYSAMYYLEQAGFLEVLRYPTGKRQFRLNRPGEPGELGEPYDGQQLHHDRQGEPGGDNVVSLEAFRHGERHSGDE